jgi:hypothetical protein
VNVVSNAGPLIALGKLGQLGLLLTLYRNILIPREVYNEVVVNGLRLGADDASAVDFLVRQGHIRVVREAKSSTLFGLPCAYEIFILNEQSNTKSADRENDEHD